MDEHVVRHGQELALHAGDGRDHHLTGRNLRSSQQYLAPLAYLEPPHVSWIASIFQAVLVTFQEEF